MGLKLECNTRRFVTDDKRELQYRVEIQNKVYRREVAALDKEINRLERLLVDSNTNSNTSSSTSLAQHKRVNNIQKYIFLSTKVLYYDSSFFFS